MTFARVRHLMLAAPPLAAFAVGCNNDAVRHQEAGSGGQSESGGSGPAAGASGSAGSSVGGGSGSGGSAGVGGSSGAGGSGAGGSGAGGDGVAGRGDPCATALFCDDFEKYAATPGSPWTPRTSSGAIAIDTAIRASGSQSVKFTTNAGSSASAMLRLQDSSILPVDGNLLYGRMLFRLEAAPTASVHWTIIQGFGTVPGQTYHAEYRYGGQMPVTQGGAFVGSQMMANYETPDWYSNKSTPGSDCWHHSQGRVIPVGVWTCVEWKFDGATNGMQLWLDGTAADDLTISGHGDGCVNAASDFAWTAPTFSAIDLGWESYQTDDPRTAYIDDVVIATSRVGCP